ncbi:MAG TPA: proline racemase family protein [Halanaerobiales bacterium]|nr:proline racemase family protein [Halanaerobiales bacterium]
MNFKRIFHTIDTHTAGEPTRTIVGGIPYIPGKSMEEKMMYMKNNMDWIRKVLMFEPRGNNVMSGVVLTEPCKKQADIGVFFIEVGGYLPMCGHDTIGVSTALIESGTIKPKEPVTKITLDTPAGLVNVKVKVENNIAKDVSFTNVPAFLFAKDEKIKVEGFGNIKVDIAYGGNFYIIIDQKVIKEELIPENSNNIIKKAGLIKKAVNQQVDIYHPEKRFINEATHVMVTGDPLTEKGDTKNVVVIPPGSIDRSPCGTGTSSRLAAEYYKGDLAKDSSLKFESIINTYFKGKIIDTTKVGKFDAIIPEITGRAYVMGINQWIIDPDDPIQEGFLLGRKTD